VAPRLFSDRGLNIVGFIVVSLCWVGSLVVIPSLEVCVVLLDYLFWSDLAELELGISDAF
jgi:hypothetical protein